jgi:hypothetical protein
MIYSLIGQLPRHQYVWVDSKFTHTKSVGFIPGVWYGLVSYVGRMWGCTVLLKSGAVYRNLPIHAVAFTDNPTKNWRPQDAQVWDCYGWEFTTLEYNYLSELSCKVRIPGHNQMDGKYLFTVVAIGDGYSSQPDQAKEFTFVRLNNGRLTVQPTNNVIFKERGFTFTEPKFPNDLKLQTEIFSVE